MITYVNCFTCYLFYGLNSAMTIPSRHVLILKRENHLPPFLWNPPNHGSPQDCNWASFISHPLKLRINYCYSNLYPLYSMSILLNSQKSMQQREYFILEEANGSTPIYVQALNTCTYIIYSTCFTERRLTTRDVSKVL